MAPGCGVSDARSHYDIVIYSSIDFHTDSPDLTTFDDVIHQVALVVLHVAICQYLSVDIDDVINFSFTSTMVMRLSSRDISHRSRDRHQRRNPLAASTSTCNEDVTRMFCRRGRS